MTTTYYVYSNGGWPHIRTDPINADLFPDYVLVETRDTEPTDIGGKRWDGAAWVRGSSEPEYAERRRAEYPPIADQLDAIWKALAVLPAGTLPPETQTVSDHIEETKRRHPKS